MPRAIKPPYIVPTMKEIGQLPPKYSVVSIFSGCGGSCLGFRMAGFKVLYASEFVPAAQVCYRANHPDTYLDTRDIREVTVESIRKATNLKEFDVMEGSPPCASFSVAGKRQRDWGLVKSYSGTKQRTDDLFFEYARLLKGLQPKVFVAENVSGLIQGTAKGYFLEILQALKACGYRVECRLLDAQWLGVPQSRRRVIFMGVRNDLRLDPVFPKPFRYYYTVGDVLPNLDSPEEIKWLPPSKQGTRAFQTVRVNKAKPSPTITTKYQDATIAVPTTNRLRGFNIEEVRVLCSFPKDFILTGKFAQQWERMGRSVPPLMMRAVANTIKKEILSCVG